jgi:hypothetical protein
LHYKKNKLENTIIKNVDKFQQQKIKRKNLKTSLKRKKKFIYVAKKLVATINKEYKKFI